MIINSFVTFTFNRKTTFKINYKENSPISMYRVPENDKHYFIKLRY